MICSRLAIFLPDKYEGRLMRRAGGEAKENVPEVEFCTRMVSLKLSSFFLAVSWCPVSSLRRVWMVCSRLTIVLFGERKCQKCRVMVVMDILECCSCMGKSSIVSSKRPSVNRQMALRVCCGKQVVVNRIYLASEYTHTVKEGRGKDIGQRPQDDFVASAEDKVVVRRDGHVHSIVWEANKRANLLECSSIPE